MNLSSYAIHKDNIYAVPIIHYNMETAAQVRLAFKYLKPDCVAVELPEPMQQVFLKAVNRLPDLTVITSQINSNPTLYYLCEPCDGAFEGLRSALEAGIPGFCIDLDVENYPEQKEFLPDPYAIHRIGLKCYYEGYLHGTQMQPKSKFPLDQERELYMARRLKELSFSYDKILYIGGMSHVQNVLDLTSRSTFPDMTHFKRAEVSTATLTPNSSRQVMAESGWITMHYEAFREIALLPPDRQKLIYTLFKDAGHQYTQRTGHFFPGYHLRNLMKFARNYALIRKQLLPDLFQILTAAKGCVDHNYAYETWLLATDYPFLKNIEGFDELDLSVEDVWQYSKQIKFHLKQPSRKDLNFRERNSDKAKLKFQPPGPFSICSFPPEDKVIENFGDFLKKKGKQQLIEEATRTQPFSNSLEEGIDVRETLRHWHEKKLYVKTSGKPPGGVGSVVIIFDEDAPQEGEPFTEKYPWLITWMGEHQQESDMAFYATPLTANVVGPGISRCEYGGFMMSYPPRRMLNVWSDLDYEGCRSKAELLLAAAIDYAIQPAVVYVASKPPRSALKRFAQRFGKKIIYIPIGQLSPITLNKLRVFHVLDSHEKRAIADDYIF